MPKICGIYKITSPTGRIYIGQSIHIKSRERDYKLLRCVKQVKVANSIKKYGWDKHSFEIIKECEQSMLNYFERYYIEFYNSNDPKTGLNLTNGGDRHTISEETKQKISSALKGNKYTLGFKHSEETRKKMSESKKLPRPERVGKPLSESHRSNIIKSLIGRKHSDETKIKMSTWQIGKKHSDETKRKISETKIKKNLKRKLLTIQ